MATLLPAPRNSLSSAAGEGWEVVYGELKMSLHPLPGGATLGSAQTTLAVSAKRGFALSERVRITVTGRLGWSHAFADNAASVTANFQGRNGSGFALSSAPIGREAADGG